MKQAGLAALAVIVVGWLCAAAFPKTFTADTLVSAITLGSLYAVIAVGYTMVYGIIKLINFAHGEIYMLGAFLSLLVATTLEVNVLFAMLIAMVLCACIGLTLDWTAYLSLRRRLPLADHSSIALLFTLGVGAIFYKLTGDPTHPLYSTQGHAILWWVFVAGVPALMLGLASGEKFGMLGRSLGAVKSDRLSALITAIGMSLVLQTLVMLIWGADYRAFPREFEPEFLRKTVFSLGEAKVLGKELLIWVVSIGMMVFLQLLVTKTKIGTAMRACSQDRETAALMGISVDRVIAFTFIVGSSMAAVAGVLYALKAGGNISFRMGYYPGLLAFAAAVLGGIGNIQGAMLGGVMIGFVQGFTGGTFSFPFLVMILILLVRPWGILGTPEGKRA